MSKRSFGWNESKYERYRKEHRGEGAKENYIPWLNIQDFPSRGRVARVSGIKTKRMHCLFSSLEINTFYLFDWSKKIIDIREQFPLLEVDETIEIAKTLGIAYPYDRESKFPIVMTTDFLLTVEKEDGLYSIARTVKPSSVLDEKRVIEKFEVERLYWAERNVDWGIVTEKEIPMDIVKNIQLFHSRYDYKIEPITCSDFGIIVTHLKQFLVSRGENAIQQSCFEFDEINSFPKGTSINMFRYLVARNELVVNLTVPFNFKSSFNSIVSVPSEGSGGYRYDIC